MQARADGKHRVDWLTRFKSYVDERKKKYTLEIYPLSWLCTGLYFLVAFWRAYNQSGWMDKLTLWMGLVGAVASALDMAMHLDAAIPWARRVPLPARIVTCALFSAYGRSVIWSSQPSRSVNRLRTTLGQSDFTQNRWMCL
jgi:hypothetical protein